MPGRLTTLPAVAGAVAASYLLVAGLLPAGLALVVVAAALAGCATVLPRRRSRRLTVALVGLAAWLLVAMAGAFLLRDAAIGGLVWIGIVLFLVPLPLVPWLYAATFSPTNEPQRVGPETGGTSR